jgi:uncharacterized protein YdeI (YjbR/CyaY-like superfamily)
MNISKTLYVANRNDWRAWLAQNHATEKEIWLIYYKKASGQPRIPYDDAVEEALCFGWIDSIIQRIDDEKYAQKFTPRTNTGKWSPSNITRIRKMIAAGKMMPVGMAKIDEDLLKSEPKPRPRVLPVPKWLKDALMKNPFAWQNFCNLAPSHRTKYIGWISDARKEETRQKRIAEAIQLLEKNSKLGLK